MPQGLNVGLMKLSEAYKEIYMKRFFGYALIFASLAVPAIAAKNSQNITISTPVKVGTTQLPVGQYKVTWTGTGSAVQVTIAEKGKASVTVPAKLVEAKNGHVAVQVNKANGGVDVLEAIQLDNFTLQLAGATASGE
jgi:hypothetical protein